MKHGFLLFAFLMLSVFAMKYSFADQNSMIPKEAEDELDAIQRAVPNFKVIRLPETAGEFILKTEESLTVDALRSVDIDENPPILEDQARLYDPNQSDDYPPDQAPYVAKGIKPFRFRYFNCEFNYGGWHNFAMADYAATHGFNILYPYTRKDDEKKHLPEGTKWMKWGGFIDWHEWLPEHGIPEGRYDMLDKANVIDSIVKSRIFKKDPDFQSLMIDMEHSYLSPEKLREQEWYPKTATNEEKQAFEEKYYDAYAVTYAAPVEAARRAGWKDISVYGWEPFGRIWWGLEKVNLEPETDWAWNAYGKQIYNAVDILNPSVYCFYWSPQNVAYTLANIDLNTKLARSMPEQKPIRPYYWTLLHGGGGGNRWWANQPIPDEEAQAMFALAFFTGFDGFVLWNWSGTGNHHILPPLRTKDNEGKWIYHDVMVKEGFECIPQGNSKPHVFNRYDVLHILNVDDESGLAQFQLIEKNSRDYGLTDERPKYQMQGKKLVSHLRPSSEPISAMIEGMALVKPLEYILRHGEVKIDVSAQEQFDINNILPIVRRVKLGNINIIATYDPKCIYGDEPRQIILKDFDGRKGLALGLPANQTIRLFAIMD